MLVTVWNDPVLQGAVSISLAHAAAVGDIDVSKLTPEQRHGQYAIGCVTPENAAQYQANGGIPAGWLDELIKNPFKDLVGGAVAHTANTAN